LLLFFTKEKNWEINSFQYLKGLFNEQTDPKDLPAFDHGYPYLD
jgi:hypothetical protein